MRILIASDFYPPFIGGAERQVQLLGKQLAVRGHEVSVATVGHAGLADREDDFGVTVHRLKGLTTRVPWFSKDSGRRYHPPFPDPGIVWGLRRLIGRWHPDVVHANGWIAYSCAAALLGKDIPLAVSVRDYGYSCAIRTMLHRGQICDGPAPRKCLECAAPTYGLPKALGAVAGVFGGRALLARKVAATHSVSTFVQRTIRRDLLGAGSLSQSREVAIPDIVIPSLLEQTGNGAPARHTLDSLPAEPYILFVGALQPHKGLGPLLAAYERLVSPPPLVLIGTAWPDTPKVFPMGVTVLQNLPHHNVMAAWQRCLFGVAPSVWPDPLPGVVREAMSKGRAVIGSAVGGIVDMIVYGETGLLVPPGDVKALAAAMQRLIDDPELRQRLGQAGCERVRDCTPDAVLPRFEALYEQLRGEPVRARP
jgi:glycosyltransferase involved in cell wall biosynthesis